MHRYNKGKESKKWMPTSAGCAHSFFSALMAGSVDRPAPAGKRRPPSAAATGSLARKLGRRAGGCVCGGVGGRLAGQDVHASGGTPGGRDSSPPLRRVVAHWRLLSLLLARGLCGCLQRDRGLSAPPHPPAHPLNSASCSLDMRQKTWCCGWVGRGGGSYYDGSCSSTARTQMSPPPPRHLAPLWSA